MRKTTAVKTTPQQRKGLKIVILVIIVLLLSILAYYYPAFQKWEIPDDALLIINGQEIESKVHMEQEEILLPADTIEEHLDSYFYYDAQTEMAVVTTKDKVLEMETENLTAYVNSKEIDISVPMQEIEGQLNVPIELLAPLYNINIEKYEDVNSVIINEKEKPLQKAEVQSDHTMLRKEPEFRSSWITSLSQDEEIIVYYKENNWYRTLTKNGQAGYVKKNKIKLTEKTKPSPKQEYKPALSPIKGKINLSWDYLYGRAERFQDAPPIRGINVVSPTWFHLEDAEGNISNEAYKPYVHWAHENDYQVWALFSNSFDPDITQEVLSDPQKRIKLRDQLLVLAELYELDGINFDFENMYYEDKRLYVQLIREVTPLLHEQGLTVSVDVTMPSGSKMWSQVYDRKALAETADYIMTMGYDQYPRDSQTPGPVSSLKWTEEKLQETLELVPNDKLVLGIPFYTRLWEVKEQDDGSKEVSSRALGMQEAENFIQNNNLEPEFDEETGLKYAELEQENTTYKIWLETAESIQKRIELVNEYNLAGVASWRRGFENEEIWDVIKNTLD